MPNDEKEHKQSDLDKIMAAKPAQATIKFIIPAYTDDDGKTFEKTVSVPTKKAYAIYKNIMRWKYKE